MLVKRIAITKYQIKDTKCTINRRVNNKDIIRDHLLS